MKFYKLFTVQRNVYKFSWHSRACLPDGHFKDIMKFATNTQLENIYEMSMICICHKSDIKVPRKIRKYPNYNTRHRQNSVIKSR